MNQEDYISAVSEDVTFSTGVLVGSSRCFSVETVTDQAVEGDQEFVVSILEVNGDLPGNISVAFPSIMNITIQDNTGEELSIFLFLFDSKVFFILQM